MFGGGKKGYKRQMGGCPCGLMGESKCTAVVSIIKRFIEPVSCQALPSGRGA